MPSALDSEEVSRNVDPQRLFKFSILVARHSHIGKLHTVLITTLE